MSVKNIVILLILVVAVGMLFFIKSEGRSGQFVSIGTGGITGVYYPTGGAISSLLNKRKEEYGFKATVESTGGSVFNINAVLSGDLDFGIAQSDRQYEAYNGHAEWERPGPQKELRSVFSLYPEAITLVASKESNIQSVSDLAGKRVNLGNVGSGQIQNALTVLEMFGLSENAVSAEKVKAVEAPRLLQDKRIDAFFYTVGHPNGNITEATAGRLPVRIVDITGEEVNKLIKENPYYSKTVIPADTYPKAADTRDVVTVGLKATLITAENVPEETVYALTKEVFENLESFKTLHPAYARINKQSMFEGLSAPLHPGAIRYYEEVGLLKHIPERLLTE